MKKEYDFSAGVRGKFYTKEADMNLPIYLNSKNRNFYYRKAKENGISPSQLVNKILEKELKILKDLS